MSQSTRASVCDQCGRPASDLYYHDKRLLCRGCLKDERNRQRVLPEGGEKKEEPKK